MYFARIYSVIFSSPVSYYLFVQYTISTKCYLYKGSGILKQIYNFQIFSLLFSSSMAGARYFLSRNNDMLICKFLRFIFSTLPPLMKALSFKPAFPNSLTIKITFTIPWSSLLLGWIISIISHFLKINEI